jgi:very-short-patch-repair endonuclease
LRAALTPAEIRLWQALKKSQLARRKFRRQHSMGAYVLDFYCPAESLAVELDGSAHDTAAANERDERRDAFLASLGIEVLRFENRSVLENLEGVLAEISARFRR